MKSKKYLEALEKFKDKKILVVGDILLDQYSWGQIERVNPEQPAAPLVKLQKETYALGGAANVAKNLISLGATTYLAGVLSRDHFSNRIKKLCKINKINLVFAEDNSLNIVKQRIMAHGQQVTRIDYGEKNLKKIGTKERKLLIAKLKVIFDSDMDFLILSDYNKRIFSEPFTKELISLAKKYKIKILADPKPKNIRFFYGCNVVSPNKQEAEKITGIEYSNEKSKLEEMCKYLQKILDAECIIITCGEDGVFSYYNQKSYQIKTVAREVANPTGAGDTFAATLALGLSSGLEFNEAIEIANHASGIVVEKIGTATPSKKELRKSLMTLNRVM